MIVRLRHRIHKGRLSQCKRHTSVARRHTGGGGHVNCLPDLGAGAWGGGLRQSGSNRPKLFLPLPCCGDKCGMLVSLLSISL